MMHHFEEITRYAIATLMVWNIQTAELIACANHPKKAGETTSQGGSSASSAQGAGARGFSGATVRMAGGEFKSQMTDSGNFFKSVGGNETDGDKWSSEIK